MAMKSIFERLGRKPNSATTVGWELIDYSKEDQWIHVSFVGRETFTNPMGFIQGGFLVAMLDEAMGSTVTVVTDAQYLVSTISMNVDYIRPCPVGTIIGKGRVTYMGKTIAYLEGSLMNEVGKVIARSTSSCRLIKINPDQVFAEKPN